MSYKTSISLEEEKIFIDCLGSYGINNRRNGYRKKCLEGYIHALEDYPQSIIIGWKRHDIRALIKYAREAYFDEINGK